MFMRRKATVGALLVSISIGGCASCSTPAPQDSGADSADLDVKADNPSLTLCDASWDGGTIADWSGYRRLTELSACCLVDVALDASTSLPTLEWIACANGTTNCTEVKRTWPTNNPSAFFGVGRVSHDTSGLPLLLPLGFPLSGTSGMTGFYALPSVSLVAGFRADNGNTIGGWARCPFNELAAGDSIALLARAGAGGAIVTADGPPSTITTSPPFGVRAPPGAVPGFQSSFASASRLAFDVQPSGTIELWPYDSGTLLKANNTTGAALLLDFVEGDDAYASSVYGTSGWTQEYHVAADGSVSLFRGKNMTQVTAMASDGVSLTWCESYGNSAPSDQQPNVEVWSAPYTNDAVLLANNAKKLATLPFAYSCGVSVAFQGYFATTTVPFTSAIVVRLADGSTQSISAGPGRGFGSLALVSETELWSTMNAVTDAGTIGLSGAAFARYTLGAWQ